MKALDGHLDEVAARVVELDVENLHLILQALGLDVVGPRRHRSIVPTAPQAHAGELAEVLCVVREVCVVVS